VFGSAARLDFSPEASDIDFLVEFEPMDAVSDAQTCFDLKEDLEAVFQRPVDLVTPSAMANPYLCNRVRTEQHAVFAARGGQVSVGCCTAARLHGC
jgi:uncharacterized protein